VGADPRRPKRHRRHYARNALSVDQVEQLLLQDLPARPMILDVAATPQASVVAGWLFKEMGKQTRRPLNGDKWRRGGGVSDAADLPSAQHPRVRRRYGYLIPRDEHRPRLRYHQYCRLIPVKADSGGDDGGSQLGAAEDTHAWLFHVLPEATQLSPTPLPAVPSMPPLQKHVHRNVPPVGTALANAGSRTTQILGTLHVDARVEDLNHGEALLHVNSHPRPHGKTTDFVRFAEAGVEVGGIYHADNGVQLRSAAGDFAEWHPALHASELPFDEGSVVGLFGGKISLTTDGADMVGVVSRRAMCVGAFPGKDEAPKGDIIAYLGQVPVRVTGDVAVGDKLVPSKKADGLAVSSKALETSTDQQLPPIIGIAMSSFVIVGASLSESTVDALITPPSAQAQQQHHHHHHHHHHDDEQQQQQQQQQQQEQQIIDPANDFANYSHASATKGRRRHRSTAIAVGVALVVVLVCAIGSMLSSLQQPDETSTPSTGFPDAMTPARAAGPTNNCSSWLDGCGEHGKCSASTCVCTQGWAGGSCEDLLCDLEEPSLICSSSLSKATCLGLKETADYRHNGRQGVCWPDFYQIGMVKANDRATFNTRDQALHDLTYAPHGQFLGTYERLDGWSCADMPVYMLDEAWDCLQPPSTTHRDNDSSTSTWKCVTGNPIPAFLFYRQDNTTSGGHWVVGLGRPDGGYTEPDCESNLLVFTNTMWEAKNWNFNSDVDTTPCQSNPAAVGCNMNWQECVRDLLYPRADGLIGCRSASLGFVGDFSANWHTVTSLAVRATGLLRITNISST
jgi:hypothetical protein